MSSIIAHVENLSDKELYKELREHGFPAGPVVASTRSIYKRKLTKILEGNCDDEQEQLHEIDELEEQLTQPTADHGWYSNLSYTSTNKPEEPRARPNLSPIRPLLNRGDAFVRSPSSPQHDTYYRSPGNQDSVKSQSSWKSSYFDSARGTENEINDKPSPSWVSRNINSSVSQPTSPSSWLSYGSSNDDSFQRSQTYGKSRHSMYSQVTEESPGYSARQRSSFSGIAPSSGQEMAARYRSTGFSNEPSSLLSRHNQEKQRKQSTNLTLWLVLFVALVLAVIAMSYMVYNAWSQNDPYQQIEEDVLKIMEEQRSRDGQN